MSGKVKHQKRSHKTYRKGLMGARRFMHGSISWEEKERIKKAMEHLRNPEAAVINAMKELVENSAEEEVA